MPETITPPYLQKPDKKVFRTRISLKSLELKSQLDILRPSLIQRLFGAPTEQRSIVITTIFNIPDMRKGPDFKMSIPEARAFFQHGLELCQEGENGS